MTSMQKDKMDEKYGRNLRWNEPNWLTGDLRNYTTRDSHKLTGASHKLTGACHKLTSTADMKYEGTQGDKPVQQSDLLKPLLMDIFQYGLNYAFKSYEYNITASKNPGSKDHKYTKTSNPKHVIVVGAGLAGLVAAYELAQVGHRVTVLEQTTRAGGRVYTVGEKEGLDKGLNGEAGAMRLPNAVNVPAEDMAHFLSEAYIGRFKLEKLEFVNECENGFLKFYNEPAIRAKDWNDSSFSTLWPGWDETIINNDVKGISNIDEYYTRTTKIVTDQLRKWLKEARDDHATEAKAWDQWIDIWSQFSLDTFLQSSYEAVMTKVPEEHQNGLEGLVDLLPWPQEAVRAYSVFSYTEQLDQSLVQYLRDQLGEWWSPNMHRIKGGMFLLPEAFTKPNQYGWNDEVHIYNEIRLNRRVNDIVYQYDSSNPDNNKVQVKGYYMSSRRPFPTVEGDAVIVTTPVNILRQITFTASPNTNTPPPPTNFYKAIEDIFTGPSTKLFLQTKSRFWEKGPHPIDGGFSKTNLPIGQIHYPSNRDGNLADTEKGLLLIYTWKSEALLFGSLDPDVALKEAVEQIATIHPEIEEEFELGIVHAWYNQPSAQGAYGVLKPNQFDNVKWLWKPMCNVFFAGETFSTTSGWIQGALESGLKAAYQFYVRNESDSL